MPSIPYQLLWQFHFWSSTTKTEVLRTQSLTRPGFELMMSRSCNSTFQVTEMPALTTQPSKIDITPHPSIPIFLHSIIYFLPLLIPALFRCYWSADLILLSMICLLLPLFCQFHVNPLSIPVNYTSIPCQFHNDPLSAVHQSLIHSTSIAHWFPISRTSIPCQLYINPLSTAHQCPVNCTSITC